jgi:periplasmic protein CpxP/Spy
MRSFGTVKLGLAIATALLAGTAMAQGPGGGMGMGGPGFGGHRPPMERAFGPRGDHGRWWNNPKVVEQLKLTDAQRKSFDGILLEHREKLIDLRGNVEKAELEMEPLMSADQPNEGKILSQIDKVAQARAELEKANARFLLAIRSKLTPEQWKQVQAFRANNEREGRGFERPGRDNRGPARPGHDGQKHHQMVPPPDAPPVPTAPGAGDQQ